MIIIYGITCSISPGISLNLFEPWSCYHSCLITTNRHTLTWTDMYSVPDSVCRLVLYIGPMMVYEQMVSIFEPPHGIAICLMTMLGIHGPWLTHIMGTLMVILP